MKYKFKGKEIDIPDKEIEVLVDTLDLSLEEAIETWLVDNDYEIDEEVERLTKMAKENKSVKHDAKSDKPRAKRTVVQKENPVKENIINVIAEALRKEGVIAAITNKTKIIEFTVEGREFKIDLVEHRAKKGGK